MPELPDVITYVSCLRTRIVGRRLERLRILSPFVLRTFEPAPEALEGRTIRGVRRLGKRIVLEFDDEFFAVVHLMIAGRFQWLDGVRRKPPKIAQAVFEFGDAALVLTEAAKQKRAGIHVVEGCFGLAEHERGGLDVLTASPADFAAVLRRENHTLKRALTDPRAFDGIGNAYSDEILFAARLSPLKLTSKLADDETARLHEAAKSVLNQWIEILGRRFAAKFPGPGEITAFRPEFATHGKFGQPCPVCGAPIQRIRYAENETNYCAKCQTEGRVLADRSLSRLLKDDWPRSIDEWM